MGLIGGGIVAAQPHSHAVLDDGRLSIVKARPIALHHGVVGTEQEVVVLACKWEF